MYRLEGNKQNLWNPSVPECNPTTLATRSPRPLNNNIPETPATGRHGKRRHSRHLHLHLRCHFISCFRARRSAPSQATRNRDQPTSNSHPSCSHAPPLRTGEMKGPGVTCATDRGGRRGPVGAAAQDRIRGIFGRALGGGAPR